MSCGNEYEYQKEILDGKIERTNGNKKRELKRKKRELTKKPKMK